MTTTITLTAEQVDNLFVFCEKHCVRQYDVQLELVDHLANAIEQRMSANPGETFETALNAVHASFGVLGFAGVVNQKEKAMAARFNAEKRKLYLSYFTWPKAAMSICLFLLLALSRSVADFAGSSNFYSILFLFLFCFDIFVVVRSDRSLRTGKRKLLIIETGRYSYLLWLFVFLPLGPLEADLFNFGEDKQVPVSHAYLLDIIWVLFLVGVVSYKDFITKFSERVRREYPQVFEAIAKN